MPETKNRGRIIVVDDEENIRAALEGVLGDEGYDVLTASDGESALRLIQTEAPDLVLLDIWIPGIDGIQTLKIIKNIDPDTEVVMMSGHGAIETAVKTTKFGAFDFIEKPFSLDFLLTTVAKALKSRRSRRQRGGGNFTFNDVMTRRRFIGASKKAKETRQFILEASEKETPAILLGEKGLGKKFAARMIHALGERRDHSFVEIACEGMTRKNFNASLLGGGGKGSRFELAAGGSLFFNRVDLLKPELRKQLFALLEKGSFTIPGSRREVEIDTRIMASAGPEGEQAVASAIPSSLKPGVTTLAPLRERKKDIIDYVDYFIEGLADEYSKHIESVDKEALKIISRAPWPENLVSLKNFLAHGVQTTTGHVLTIDHFPYDPLTASAPATGERERGGEAAERPARKRKGGRRKSGKLRQKTLKQSVVLCGQGLHSGIKTGLILSPLPPDSGIIFGDINTGARIPATLRYVKSTDYATTLSDGHVAIKTIEHIMSALHSYGLTNLQIKIGDEAPIMDGSALDFCTLIEDSGVVEQEGDIDPIVITETIEVGDPAGSWLRVEPYDGFLVNYHLEYPPPIGVQDFEYCYESPARYKEDIAPARTFGFLKDIKELNEMGLAAGGKLTNVVLIDDEKIVNTPLRFSNEPARHKILDLIGDLYLLGKPILGKFTAHKSGHTDNFALITRIDERLKKKSGASAQKRKRHGAH